MTTEIELTQGETALISDEDADRVREHSWCAHRVGDHVYASSTLGTGEGTVYLHRFIAEPEDGEDVVFRNGDGLDCRRENLMTMTFSERRLWQQTRSNSSGSRHRGVYFKPGVERWRADICYDGEKHYVGMFDSEEEAALAWLEKAEEIGVIDVLPPTLPHFDLRENS